MEAGPWPSPGSGTHSGAVPRSWGVAPGWDGAGPLAHVGFGTRNPGVSHRFHRPFKQGPKDRPITAWNIAPDSSPRRRGNEDDPKAVAVIPNHGRTAIATLREQRPTLVVAPRSAAQHTLFLFIRKPILAPLPHIPSKVEQTILVRLEAHHWSGRGEAVVVAIYILRVVARGLGLPARIAVVPRTAGQRPLVASREDVLRLEDVRGGGVGFPILLAPDADGVAPLTDRWAAGRSRSLSR